MADDSMRVFEDVAAGKLTPEEGAIALTAARKQNPRAIIGSAMGDLAILMALMIVLVGLLGVLLHVTRWALGGVVL